NGGGRGRGAGHVAGGAVCPSGRAVVDIDPDLGGCHWGRTTFRRLGVFAQPAVTPAIAWRGRRAPIRNSSPRADARRHRPNLTAARRRSPSLSLPIAAARDRREPLPQLRPAEARGGNSGPG